MLPFMEEISIVKFFLITKVDKSLIFIVNFIVLPIIDAIGIFLYTRPVNFLPNWSKKVIDLRWQRTYIKILPLTNYMQNNLVIVQCCDIRF